LRTPLLRSQINQVYLQELGFNRSLIQSE